MGFRSEFHLRKALRYGVLGEGERQVIKIFWSNQIFFKGISLLKICFWG